MSTSTMTFMACSTGAAATLRVKSRRLVSSTAVQMPLYPCHRCPPVFHSRSFARSLTPLSILIDISSGRLVRRVMPELAPTGLWCAPRVRRTTLSALEAATPAVLPRTRCSVTVPAASSAAWEPFPFFPGGRSRRIVLARALSIAVVCTCARVRMLIPFCGERRASEHRYFHNTMRWSFFCAPVSLFIRWLSDALQDCCPAGRERRK